MEAGIVVALWQAGRYRRLYPKKFNQPSGRDNQIKFECKSIASYDRCITCCHSLDSHEIGCGTQISNIIPAVPDFTYGLIVEMYRVISTKTTGYEKSSKIKFHGGVDGVEKEFQPYN